MDKKPVVTVTRDDCRWETFTVGGHGGSGKDTSNSGVRVTHTPSGAVGKCVDNRSQARNRQVAFSRMANSAEMQAWLKLETSRRLGKVVDLNAAVDEQMAERNLRVEVQEETGWVTKKLGDPLDKPVPM